MRWGGRLVIASSRLQAEHQVGAALGGGHRVDLVDDHGVDVDQGAAHLAGEHQVEALGGGDQQIHRAAGKSLAVARAGIAGAHRHGRLHEGHAEPLRRMLDTDEWRAQVLLDVEGQRPERGDVEHPGARLGIRRFAGDRRGDQAVDAGEEGR